MPFFRGENVPDGHVAHVNPVQSRFQIRRQFAIQKIHDDLAGGRRFQIARPNGALGLTMMTGRPLRANFTAINSACHLERL